MNTTELCRRLQVTPREVQWWHETGAISCTYVKHSRVFDEDDALRVGIVSELRRKGIPMQRIRRMKLTKLQGEFLVALKGRGAVVWCSPGKLVECVSHAPGPCVVVSLEDLRAKLWPEQKTSAFPQSQAAMQTR